MVKESAGLFDAVAIATATHKIASFRKPAVYYRRIAQDLPFKELIRLIGADLKLQPENKALVEKPKQANKILSAAVALLSLNLDNGFWDWRPFERQACMWSAGVNLATTTARNLANIIWVGC